MNTWESFLIAEVGASAALAGLIFVGVSINLPKILSTAALPNRAMQAVIFLLAVLAISSLLLIPELSLVWSGLIILAGGLILWVLITRLDRQIFKETEKAYRGYTVSSILVNQVATLLYILTGIAVLVWGSPVLFGLAFAVVLSFIKAISDAWVLLVEINR